ncbi:glycoside hydrolase family 28 protein [Guyanagaster necrorhizus]|uniref:galacturonan 1,4-alpha-galacturonidase n=1 Tax=Guyanagaster necrorhizus TaxID=856835 RepID=A0A9P8AXW5_9AGAR|nr:glycoside hydrolase family 28 protein [Guyanagaster necrorhizus MCA 3950]KAG7451641.1 glycoside hydrolase family 28 protein [Guyanagaster necrorhizus MCA 3950]
MFRLLYVLLLTLLVAFGQRCTLTPSGGDDGPQFLAAAASCDTVVIPVGEEFNIATRMNMTGLTNTHINLEGTIRFQPDISYWTGNAFFFDFQDSITFWLLGGENIVLSGSGTLDGAGQAWYDAFASNSSLLRPIILTVYQAKNALVEDIHMVNSPMWFNLVYESNNVTYSNINITAVSTSKNTIANTDGWDIYRSDTVVIRDSTILNGDDCVSFKPNTTNVLVSNLSCNGSHGVSVGSLGQYAGIFDIVENITATDISMSNAENGARIKAWAGSDVGSGIVKNITFANFEVSNVDNPIVIDQCYETSSSQCSEFPSNTFIEDVWFNDVFGTSSGATVASLECSPDDRCSNINVNDLNLKAGKGTAKYECQNIVLSGNSVDLFPDCTET